MDGLILPLKYGGGDMELPLNMYAYGYSFRVEVLIGETAVIFEPDEEGSFRALADKAVGAGLLKAIAESLGKLR